MLNSKIDELTAQIDYYERREFEFKETEQHMRNSYRSFIKETETLKKQLSLLEIRFEEMKVEKTKMEAELSERIEVLMQERQSFQELDGNVWFTFQKHQLNMLGLFANRYNAIQINLNLDDKTVKNVMPVSDTVAS